jgi:hypothetical protein
MVAKVADDLEQALLVGGGAKKSSWSAAKESLAGEL